MPIVKGMSFGKLFTVLLFVTFAGCITASAADWEKLLDKDLSKWGKYLGYAHKVGYKGAVPTDENGRELAPIGYDKDETGVFTVKEMDGDLVLHVSGEIYGCVFTKKDYRNYHLRLKVKWGTAKFDPRKDKLKDTGILYHSQGEAGVDYWRAWMLSQEFQIMEGHMGDFWSIANSAIDIRAFIPENAMNSVASLRQPFRPFGAGESIASFCLRESDEEVADGGWNTLELICHEGRSLHIVNGKVVMALRDSRYVKDGKSTPLYEGKIQLQCEAAEVFFKDVEITPIDGMPAKYARIFE